MPPPLCGLNWHSAGGRKARATRSAACPAAAPSSPPPRPPGTPSLGPRRRQPACAWGSGSLGSAPGRPAPGDALCSGCRLPAHCGAGAGGGPSASARRTPTPRARAGGGRGTREKLSYREESAPGPALRWGCATLRGGGGGADRDPELEPGRAGAPVSGPRGVVAGGGDPAAGGGGARPPPLPTLRGRDRSPGEVSLVPPGRLSAGLERGAGITRELRAASREGVCRGVPRALRVCSRS